MCWQGPKLHVVPKAACGGLGCHTRRLDAYSGSTEELWPWGLRLSFWCSKRKIIYNSPGRGWEGTRLEAEKPSDGAVVLENFQVLN